MTSWHHDVITLCVVAMVTSLSVTSLPVTSLLVTSLPACKKTCEKNSMKGYVGYCSSGPLKMKKGTCPVLILAMWRHTTESVLLIECLGEHSVNEREMTVGS